MATKKTTEEVKETTLNEDFESLNQIITNLNKSDISIEDAFEQYALGMELLKKCSDKVDKVEKSVLALSESMNMSVFDGVEE